MDIQGTGHVAWGQDTQRGLDMGSGVTDAAEGPGHATQQGLPCCLPAAGSCRPWRFPSLAAVRLRTQSQLPFPAETPGPVAP